MCVVCVAARFGFVASFSSVVLFIRVFILI